MVSNSELLRRINNLINFGTVTEISTNKKLARVDILGRETDFLPIKGDANSFKRRATPVRVNEQVVVICPMGNSDFGFILAGFFNEDCKEPDGFNENVEVEEYSDGSRFSYDVKSKELKIDASNKITIIAGGDVDVTCVNASLKADSVKVDSASIDLGLGGSGVVTGECKCAFTGLPHPDMSGNTRSRM